MRNDQLDGLDGDVECLALLIRARPVTDMIAACCVLINCS